MSTSQDPHERRRLLLLAGAAAACYAVGYPLALVAHLGLGWVLVSAGGVLLLLLGVRVVRRLAGGDGPRDDRPDGDRPGGPGQPTS